MSWGTKLLFIIPVDLPKNGPELELMELLNEMVLRSQYHDLTHLDNQNHG